MNPQQGVLLFLLFLSITTARVEEETDNLMTVDDDEDEDESEASTKVIRKDPSELDGSVTHGSGISDHIKLGVADGVACPHSCFCEEEDAYVSCIGGGEWGPPFLPKWLRRLEIRRFFLPELERMSVYLPGLRELQIQQSNLSEIHTDTFISLNSLDHLDLSQNRLGELSPGNFNGLIALRHLDISSNLIRNMSRPFVPLVSLEHLNLRDNKLERLDADTFIGLEKVQYVNLDGNYVHFVDVAAFQHLGSLAHLILSNNPLSNLARLNFFGSRLQYIDVSNIGIHKVPQSLTQFVRDLRLAKNKITEIHRGDLDSYPYLGLLVLDDNGLEVLEEDALGRHEYLARVWLNGNKLKFIPQSLPISLKALYMEENSITSLNESDFNGLNNLEQLYLQRNVISSITRCAFCGLTRLKSLDLQANNLTHISDLVFKKLYSLESLDLSQNPLAVLSAKSFIGLSATRVLQISRIRHEVHVPETLFDPLTSLQTLEMYGSPYFVKSALSSTRLLHSIRGIREINLMHNGLSHLRKDFFNFFSKLTLIKLSGNAWDCSTKNDILWLQKRLKSSRINFYRSYSVRCSIPAYLGNKPVLLLDEEDFPSEITTTPTTTTTTTRPGIIKSVIASSAKQASEHKLPVEIILTTESLLKDLDQLIITPVNGSFDESVNVTDSESIESGPTSYNNVTEMISESDMKTIKRRNFNREPFQTTVGFNVKPVVSADLRKLDSGSTSYNSSKISPTPLSDSLKEVSRSANNVKSLHSTHNLLKQTTVMSTSIYPYGGSEASDTHSKYDSLKQDLDGSLSFTLTEVTSESPLKNLNDPWIFKEKTFTDNTEGINVHILKRDNSLVVSTGLISACFGIAVIVGGYILARRISKKNRRLHLWKNSRTSFWNRREGTEGQILVGIGDTGAGTLRESDGTLSIVTESHHGLNNRLYLLLQRSSDTGITPESLPDPTLDAWPIDSYPLSKSDIKPIK